ncbi:hypothetical protein N9L20_04995 [Flavobacteriaceae bacterium]|nr:hypothetical protein [Flavobacteriaceae bacterium]
MKTTLLILTLFLALMSCSKEDRVTSIQEDQKALYSKYNSIMSYISLETITTETTCLSLPIGSKACGGPQGYIGFPSSIDQDELKQMIEEYTKFEKSYNEKWEITSDCSFVSPPAEVIVHNGSCKVIY